MLFVLWTVDACVVLRPRAVAVSLFVLLPEAGKVLIVPADGFSFRCSVSGKAKMMKMTVAPP